MPYKISIPLSYQSESYTFPPTYTTTASRIYLSETSPLARAIYTSALEWGWHVIHEAAYSSEAWAAYVARRKRKGYLNDLWRIWQRETGLRIREGSGMRERKYGKELGRWVYKWVVLRGDVKAELGEGGGRTESRGIEMLVGEDVEVESLTGSLVEALEALDMDRRRRELGEGVS